MKKICIIFVSIFAVIAVGAFCALIFVGKAKSLEEQVSASVSEYRENYFYAKTDHFIASFTDGEREKDYIYNGVKTELVDYGVVVVKTDLTVADEKLDFELTVAGNLFVGEMERNPFDSTFVFDIETRASPQDEVELYIVDFDVRLTLVCLSKDWEITAGKALTKFVEVHKQQLQNYVSSGVFQGEVYIKLVADTNDENNIYFYVLAVCKDSTVFGSLIDVKTGEVVQN
jgi:hypothetical protein